MDDKDFPDIETGNGIDRNLAATANDRIKKAVIEINGLKSAVASLEKTIVNLSCKNEKLQKRIFWLTVVGVTLAATQVVQFKTILGKWKFKKKKPKIFLCCVVFFYIFLIENLGNHLLLGRQNLKSLIPFGFR